MEEKIKISKKANSYLGRTIIIDASVILKAFVEEEGSELVDELILLNKMKRLSLIAPSLLAYELLNVLSKKWHNAKTVRDALRILGELEIGIVDYQYGFLDIAAKKACRKSSVSLYDCAYHALAKELDSVFLTADKKYYSLMKNDGNIELFKA